MYMHGTKKEDHNKVWVQRTIMTDADQLSVGRSMLSQTTAYNAQPIIKQLKKTIAYKDLVQILHINSIICSPVHYEIHNNIN